MLHYRPGEASNCRGFAKGHGGRASHDAADARRMEIALARSGAGHGVPGASVLGAVWSIFKFTLLNPARGTETIRVFLLQGSGQPPWQRRRHYNVEKRADSEGGVGNGGDAFRSTWGRDVLGSAEVKRSRCPRAKLQEARLARWTYRLQVASTTRLIGK